MDKKGLTLLEVLVSVFLLSLIMLGLVNVFLASKRHLLGSRSQITAAELERYFLGNLSMQVRQDEWGSNCLSNSSYCANNSQTIDNINYTAQYGVTPNFDGTLSKVTVNITWNEPAP